MKRFVLAALAAAVVALASSPAHAMGTGVRVGLNLSNFGGADGDDMGMDDKLGLVGGVVFSPSPNFDVEIVYSEKGAETDIGGGLTYSIEGACAQVNALGKVGSPDAKLVLGGYVAMKVGKVEEVLTDGTTTLRDDSIDDVIKDTEYGLVIGASFGGGKASFDLRYEMSLDSIFDVSGVDVTNEVITAGVTFRF